MTVYAFGLTNADISDEMPHYTFGSATKPSTTQIDVWITEYAAQVVTRLEAIGVADQDDISTTITPSVNEAQYYTIRSGIKQAVISRVHMADQEQTTEWSEETRTQWDAFLARLDGMQWRDLGDLEAGNIGVQMSWTSDRVPYWSRTTSFD
jgi:hypothetical protein